jgi:PAS domain S-box-containing protein
LAVRLRAGCLAALIIALTLPLFAEGSYGFVAILGLVFTAGLFAGWWIGRRDPNRPAANEALHAKVFQSTTEGATITDAGGCILAVNRAFARLAGYSAQEVIGKSPSILSSGRHDAAFYNNMLDDILANGCWVGEAYNRRKNGEISAEWLRISKVPDASGAMENYIGIFSDITERKASEELLVQSTYSDALTGAANRPYLNKCLDHKLS